MPTTQEIIDKIIYLLNSEKARWEFSRYGSRNDFEENHVWVVGREILKSLDGFQVYKEKLSIKRKDSQWLSAKKLWVMREIIIRNLRNGWRIDILWL